MLVLETAEMVDEHFNKVYSDLYRIIGKRRRNGKHVLSIKERDQRFCEVMDGLSKTRRKMLGESDEVYRRFDGGVEKLRERWRTMRLMGVW